MEVPLNELARHGHDVTLIDQKVRAPSASDYLDGNYDVAVGQRLSNYEGLMMWRRCRLTGTRLAYELDDDVWNVTQDNWQAYGVYQDAPLREAIKAYMEISDVVTATTSYLANVYSEWNPNVRVLPNCVPGWVLDLPHMNEDDPGRRPRVGWIGGASHGRDIHMATPALRRFIRRNAGWDLFWGGTDYRSVMRVPLKRQVFAPWVQVNEDPEGFYRSYDFEIGVCPLLNTAFARSKSAVKALEMNARGIPVVAQDIGPYQEYVTHGVNGFLAKTDSDWLRYVSELANDDDLRRKMSLAALDRAREYTIENQWQEWEKVYQEILP